MEKMNKNYEAPKAEVIEMQTTTAVLTTGSGDPFGSD